MPHYLIFAISYAFAVTIQPGPLLTYIVSRTLAQGWKRTLPVAFAPLLSDGPIIAGALLLLSRMPEGWDHYLQIAGGLFLLFLAYRAFGAFRSAPPAGAEPSPSGMRDLFSAAAVNLLNPGPYLGWSLVMGPLLLKAWRESPAWGIALLASFYGTLSLTLAAIILLFSFARRLGPRVNRVLIGTSVVALTGFALCELWLGTLGLAD